MSGSFLTEGGRGEDGFLMEGGRGVVHCTEGGRGVDLYSSQDTDYFSQAEGMVCCFFLP